MSEAELIERARQGDTAAFGELVERYQASVFRTALAALRSREDAEDIAQEAFVAAYQKLDHFRGDASFKTWLLAIAWRRALDRRKTLAETVRRFVPVDGPEPGADLSVESSQEADLVEADRRAQVRRLVRRLPRKFREVLLLMATGEYTFEEVARVLDIPVGTAKWRASEGRRILKDKLIRLGYGNE